MGYPRVLSDEAKAALDAVTRARAEQVAMRAKAEAAAARMVADLTRDADLALAQAVRAALDLDVPHTRVGREGLDSRDWGTVERALAPLTDTVAA